MQSTVTRMAAATISESSSHYNVIVLGAGMSGLACASRLYQNQHYQNKSRLLVLEARHRIGGRIESVHVKGSRLDTGANWIHGVGTKDGPNPLMSILPHKRCKQLSGTVAFSAGLDDHGEDGDWVKVEKNKIDGTPDSQDLVIPASTAETIMTALWDTIGALHQLAASTSAAEAKDTTVLDSIKKTKDFQQAFQQVPPAYHRTLAGMPQFVEVMEAAPLTAQSAECPKGTSGMSLLEYAINDFDGDQVFLQDGYTAIIDEVAKDLLAADLIRTGEEIEQIDWHASPIRIRTSRSSYTADQIVCTLPLGVLQHHTQEVQPGVHNKPSLFTPPLPTDKRTAIHSLGFGTLDKIFLVYNQPWWTKERWTSIWKHGLTNQQQTSPDSFMGFTSSLPGLSIPQPHPDNTPSTTSSQAPRLLSLLNLHSLTCQPALSCFVSCSTATKYIEPLTDTQASDLVHTALTKWLGQEPPRPDAVHVTRWASDEFSRGSYSHMIAGLSETRHREEFQRPVVARGEEGGARAGLRFAGEHTSTDHFATVHGALLSGWREADEILKGVGM